MALMCSLQQRLMAAMVAPATARLAVFVGKLWMDLTSAAATPGWHWASIYVVLPATSRYGAQWIACKTAQVGTVLIGFA
jgi:hypothetical protein